MVAVPWWALLAGPLGASAAVAFLLARPCFVLAVQAKELWLAFVLFLIIVTASLVQLRMRRGTVGS